MLETPSTDTPLSDYAEFSREALEQALYHHLQHPDRRRQADTHPTLLHHVIDKARFSVMITDASQKIVYVNQAYTQMTGLSAEDVIGQTPKINQSGRHPSRFYEKMWQAIAEKGLWRGEVWDRYRDGTFYLKRLSIQAIRNEQNDVTHYLGIFSDLSHHQRTEEELEKSTHYDPLTQLPNRILFRNRLGHEFNISNRHDSRTGLLVLNLDRFRMINDAFGFAVGDELLIQVAKRLRGKVRSTDLLARQEDRSERDSDLISRIGGDDFSFILSELREPEDANVVARRLLDVFKDPFVANGEEVFLSGSIGIAVYPDNASNEDDLMRCAETALGRVRSEGKGGYQFFSEAMNQSSAERVRLESKLHKATSRQEFQLHYQPKLDLTTHRIVGMEALLRWPQEDDTHIPPASFIPLAEDTGLIKPIGRWIIFQAMQDTQQLNQRTGKRLHVAINLSARQFVNPGLLEIIHKALEETGIDPELVEFEITESMLIDKIDQACQIMQKLRDLGVRLAIDDFGTGYSSLSYLKNFPVNTMKIDRSFISPLENDAQSVEMVRALVLLGKAIGVQVVAEGVEHHEQLQLVEQAGCHLAQGFYIERPIPLEQLIQTLEAENAKRH